MSKDKHGDFLRIASVRTEKVIQRIEQLERCANRASYEYSAEEVEQIFAAIEESLSNCRKAFEASSKEKRNPFILSASPLPGQMSIEEQTELPMKCGRAAQEP